MINMNQTFVKAYVTGLVEDKMQDAYEMDYNLTIEDVDDLHDWTIESQDICQIDRVYDALYAMLPVIFEDVIEYIEEAEDYDEWGTYAMRESVGFCDF